MRLGVWVRVGWFQLPRKKGEGSERVRCTWPGGSRTRPSFLAAQSHTGDVRGSPFSAKSRLLGAGAATMAISLEHHGRATSRPLQGPLLPGVSQSCSGQGALPDLSVVLEAPDLFRVAGRG